MRVSDKLHAFPILNLATEHSTNNRQNAGSSKWGRLTILDNAEYRVLHGKAGW